MSGPRRHVLVVEDEPEALAALARFLTHRGFAVTPAGNGSDAVRLCRERAFDAVLTDLRMPGTDGHGLIAQLKQDNPTVPIVVMTGQAGFDTARAPDDGAVAATLRKPLDLREVDALLRHLTKGLGDAATRDLGLAPTPRVHGAAATLARRRVEQSATEMSDTAPRREVVLIVDDDRQQAEQIASFLTRYGISVVQEDNGFGAVNTIRRVQPAVVVMDVRMPGLDGIGAAKLAAKMEPSPRIILMSGYVDQVRKATKEDLDVFAVVEKPIPLKVLARFINNALARA